MADEQLRLVASVTDQFTNPLRSLRSQLNSIAINPVGKAMAKDWTGVREGFGKITSEINTGLAPAISRLGIQSFGAGAAVASIGLAVKSFATSTRHLNLFSKSVGLGVTQLRELQAVGEHFGVSMDQTQGSLKAFAGNIDQIHRRWGNAYGQLRAMNLGELAEKLVSAPNMQSAIDTAIEGLKSIQNPVRRREVAELLFGSDQWATVAAELTPSLRKSIKDAVAAIPAESAAAADGFALNMTKIGLSLEKLKVESIGPLLPAVNDLMAAFNQPQTFAFIKTEFDGVATGVKSLIGEIQGALEWLKNAKDAAGSFLGGEKTGGAVRNGIMPETSIGEALSNPEIAKRKLLADQARRGIDVQDEIINRKESRGEDSSESRRRRDKLAEEIKRLADEIQTLRKGGATVQQQSFGLGGGGGGGLGGLIQNASLGGGVDLGGAGFRWGYGRGWEGYTPRIGSGAGGTGSRSGGSRVEGTPGFVPVEGKGVGHSAPNREREAYVRAEAAKRGIDPDIAVRVAKSEGFGRYVGDKGTSFGDWQLHFKNNIPGLSNGGLGDVLMKRHKIDARDPSTWREQTQFALDEAAKGGWAPWHGWRGPARAGLSGARAIGITKTAEEQASRFPPVRSRDDLAKAAGTADVMYPLGWGRRMDRQAPGIGDSMMGRAFGPGGVAGAAAAPVKAEGSVNIHLAPGMQDARAKVDYDGMFKAVQVTRGSQVA